MNSVVSFKSAALAFFFLQGLLFAFLLLRAAWRHDHRASYWLAAFVMLCSLYLVPFLGGYSGWYGKDGYREILFFVPFQQFFLIGPIIYCYVKSQLEPDWKITRKDYWHFIPGLLYLGYILVAFIMDVLVLEEYYFYADNRDKDLTNGYQITGLFIMIVYSAVAYRYYRQYQQRIFAELSFAEAVAYRWVGRFLIALLIIMVLRILALVFLPSWGSFGRWFPYYTAFGAITYYIALAGYTNMVRSMARAPLQKEQSLKPEEAEPSGEQSAEDLSHWKPKVVALMEVDKLYENPTLTLTDVAQVLGVNRRQVSTIINQEFEQNFNDFVNSYRVEAVKSQFIRGDHQQFTILSIALGCGFNSKTTFNRVFKKHTARTPMQWLGEH